MGQRCRAGHSRLCREGEVVLRVAQYLVSIQIKSSGVYMRLMCDQMETDFGDKEDGKLVMQQKSFYHVNDMPDFAKNKVLEEARRQIDAAGCGRL